MSRNKKTLVILTPGFPKDETDTTCLPMQQSFTRTLQELYPGLNLVVLAFQYPYFKKRYQWFGIPVISFDGRNKGGLTRLLLRQKLYSTLKEIHQSSEVIGLLSFWLGECALVGKRFAGKHDLRHFCWLMGQDAKKENTYPGRLRPTANELVALSDFLQDEFEKNHGIRPRYVIPPGVDTKQFGSRPGEKDIDLLAAGSLIPLKQYDIFVKVITEIKKERPGIKAVLIGGGPEKNKLQVLITEYGLQSTIILTGELSHPEVLEYMHRAKVFLHPSSYEGFGVVSIEALQAGCHVASFCKPMKQEIERWHIVSSKEEMSKKVLSILNDPAANDKRVTFSTMENTVKKIMGLFLK